MKRRSRGTRSRKKKSEVRAKKNEAERMQRIADARTIALWRRGVAAADHRK
jgi:hypothetical protein